MSLYECTAPSMADIRLQLMEEEVSSKESTGSVAFITEGLRIERSQWVSSYIEIFSESDCEMAGRE